MDKQPIDFPIDHLPIRLGQFLKLAITISSGFEATIRISNGEVGVNGKIELQRGRKLQLWDKISCGNQVWRIIQKKS
jgi:ribosome-associated protein